MQNVSTAWKSNALLDYTLYDISISVDGVSYSTFPTAPVIHRYGMTEDLIGGALSAALEFSIIPTSTIPKAAECIVWAANRAAANEVIQGDDNAIMQGDDNAILISRRGTGTSESICLGTFYINTREPDKTTGIVKFTAYDAMRKGDVPFYDNQGTYPMTSSSAVAVIAGVLGIQTVNCSNLAGKIDTPVGVYTYRETLAYIAAMNGGNFIIDENNKLKFVKLTTPATAETTCMAASLEMGGDPVTVSKVMLFVDSGVYVQAGTDQGNTLSADCPFGNLENANYASAALTAINGVEYYPYHADTAPLDPAVQIGDTVTVSHQTFNLYNYDLVLGRRPYFKIQNPGKSELEQEYTFADPDTRAIDRTVARSYSEIKKTTDEISLAVVQLQNQFDKSVDLIASAYEFIKVSGSFTPATITISDANAKQGGTYKWYIDGTQVTGSASSYTLNNTAPSTRKKLVKCSWTDGVNTWTDELSIVWLEDGASGTYITSIIYGTSTSSTTEPSSYSTTIPSLSPGDWLWVKTTYSNGMEFITKSYAGEDGSNGTSSYIHIAWAESADGSTGFSTTTSAGKSYIGTYTDTNATASQSYQDYYWSLIKGTDGNSFNWNLIHNTLDPSVASTAVLPSINGFNGAAADHEAGFVNFSSGTSSTAEHGVKITNSAKTRTLIRFGNSTFSTGGLYGLVPGKTYTISFDASWKLLSNYTGSANTYLRAGLTYGTSSGSSWVSGSVYNNFATINNTNKGTEMSGRCEFTFTVPSNATKLFIIVADTNATASNYASGDYIEIRNIMLNEGSTASAWAPCYEETIGPAGRDGQDGQDGAPGQDGRDGQDGAPGQDGQDGADGQDGYTIVLTNPYVEIPVDANRHPIASDSYVCSTRVYKGTTLLTPVFDEPGDGEYSVVGGNEPYGLSVIHSPAGTFTLSTIESGVTPPETYNLFDHTLNPDMSSKSTRISVNGYNGEDERGYITFPSNTRYEAAAHGVTVTSTAAVRPYVTVGTTNIDNAGMYGLSAGTYTISFDAEWDLLNGTAGSTTANFKIHVYTDENNPGVSFSKRADLIISEITRGEHQTARCEKTFYLPSSVTAFYLRIGPSIETANNYKAGDYFTLRNMMLNAGSTAKPYAPSEAEFDPGSSTLPISDFDEFPITITPYGAQELTTKVVIRANMNQEVAEQRAEIDIQSNKISLVVQETAGGNVIKAAEIVEAINETGSQVKISADKVDITGFVTFSNLTDGQTTISGSNIKTGSINASSVAVTNLNASNITSGYLNARYVGVSGALEIYNAGYIGAAASANVGETAGACISSTNGLGYYLATNSGSRITYGDYSIYCSGGGAWTNDSGGVSVSSDRRLKTDINYDLQRLNGFFDSLRPCTFKRIDIEQDKTNIGLIAQDVLIAEAEGKVQELNLAIVKQTETPGREGQFYGVSYSELISLCIDQIQKLKARVDELESEFDDGK